MKHATKFINLILAMLLSYMSFAQEKQNYIVSRVFLDTLENESQTSVQYFDGLGRPIQGVQVGMSPDGKDIIQHIDYDDLGRESRKYLPYVSEAAGGFYRETAETDQESFYTNPGTGIAESTMPWGDIVFDGSPLNRVLEQGAPGEAWEAIEGDTDDHSVHFSYEANATDDAVIMFEVNESNHLVVGASYENATLYKNSTRDENEVWSSEYKNLLGQVVLKESDTQGLKLRTYYVYDNYGLLRYVMPPKAAELLGAQTSLDTSDALIKNLCYYYQYDGRKRMILKKLPGAEPVYMVYDNRDRLVLTQDGNLRDQDKWMFTKYDVLNRPIITGIYQHDATIDQDSMQTIVNNSIASSNVYIEHKSGNYTDDNFGYTNDAFPELGTNDEILTVSYYDTYDFDFDSSLQDVCLSEDTEDFPTSVVNMAVKGLVTGSKVRILGTDSLITSINMYDNKYRPIRSYSENPFLEKTDLVLSQYDFVGTVLKTWQIHQKSSSVNDTIHIKQRFEYDHAKRLLAEYHKLSTNPEVQVAANTYNELGQLIKKDLHKTNTGNPLQSVDYTYNIRGWLTKINDPDNLTGDLFAMELAYNDPTNIGDASSTQAQYNGNISAMRWTDDKFNENSAYVFNYDQVNRLTGADYQNYESSSWNTTTNEFDLDLVDYDENGNILALKRYGDNEALAIDDLTYSYTDNSNYTNQLQIVSDLGESAIGFKDYTNTIDYEYDKNGNLITDRNKGIDKIEYNYLNLPMNIIGGTDTISYIYAADGTKIAKVNKDKIIKQYLGNIIYDEDELDYILTSEGMVKVATGNTYTYEYFLKDHLGNTRVAFYDSSNVAAKTQVNHYYPFGMNISAFAFSSQTDNKYKYNGKELQDDVINGTQLDWYDYGARMYDAALGRWHVQDPLAEWYLQQSPYNYVGNNPINYIDPDGMRISKEDRQRRRAARKKAKATGGKFKRWRGHGKNRGKKYWSITYNSSSSKGGEIGSAKSSSTVYSAEKYDQEYGDSYTTEGGGAMSTDFTSRYWGGYTGIDLIFTAFKFMKKAPVRVPGPPKIEDYAYTAKKITDIVVKLTPDKEIMQNAGNNNELIIEKAKKFVRTSSWKTGNIAVTDSVFTYPNDSTSGDSTLRHQSNGVVKIAEIKDGFNWRIIKGN